MFHFVTFLVGAYVATRFIAPLPWPLLIKIILVCVIVPVSVHHLLNKLVFGDMFSPEVPRPVILIVSWIFASMLLLAVFQFSLDLITLVPVLFKGHAITIAPIIRYGFGIFALGLAAFGVAQAVRVPPVKEVEIPIAGLPKAFDGYRLVQLTDLHISRLFERPWAESVVARTNALNADLIVLTGDLIDGIPENRKNDIEPLKDLRAKDGVYVIPGNHEYYFGYAAWMERFAELGMNTLSNSHAVIKKYDNSIVLAGVTDVTASRTGLPGPDVAEAIEGAPKDTKIILLDHQPKNAMNAANMGAAIQLSGHTHGGLVVGLDRLIARYNNGFVSGLYDVGGMHLYISNGTGLWPGFALRLGKPSEITMITLKAK